MPLRRINGAAVTRRRTGLAAIRDIRASWLPLGPPRILSAALVLLMKTLPALPLKHAPRSLPAMPRLAQALGFPLLVMARRVLPVLLLLIPALAPPLPLDPIGLAWPVVLALLARRGLPTMVPTTPLRPFALVSPPLVLGPARRWLPALVLPLRSLVGRK